MNDSECENAYRQLVSIVADQHMEWVVKEAEERILREETLFFEEISSGDHDQLTLYSEFTAVQKAYLSEKASVAQKRLIMLIDEIYHAAVHPAECRHFLFRCLSRKGIHEVIFLSPDGNGRKLTLDKEPIQKQLHAARQLGHVLQSLYDTVAREV